MKNKSTKNEKNSINMMKSQHRTRFGMKRTVSDMPNIFAQLSSAWRRFFINPTRPEPKLG